MPKNIKNKKNRNIEKKLLIFCEGSRNKSEDAYLRYFIKYHCSFNGKRVVVEVIDTPKNTGKELVEEALNFRENKEHGSDILWIVYDKDGYTKHAETFHYAQQHNVNIAFSSISFEIWILLHKKYTTKAFSKSEDVIKYIKEETEIDYKKNDVDVIAKITDDIDTAIKNAEKLRKSLKEGYPNEKIYNLNPWTEVDLLIKDIKKLEQEYPK